MRHRILRQGDTRNIRYGRFIIWKQGWVETILVQLREQLLLVLKHDRVNQNHRGASKQSNEIGLSYNKTTARAVSLQFPPTNHWTPFRAKNENKE